MGAKTREAAMARWTEEEWRLSAVARHEGAHAVACVVLDAPFLDVQITVEKRLFRGVLIGGSVCTDVPGPGLTATQQVLVALAGPEAEALHTHQSWGIPLRDTRRDAVAQNHDDDIPLATSNIGSGQTPYRNLRAAERDVQNLVAGQWRAICKVSAQLERHHHLTAQQVRRIAR